MTALAVRKDETALAPVVQQQGVDFGALMEFARELVPTGFLPDHIKNPAQAVAIILAGRELGMEPMLALRSISMVKGKIVVAADAQLALFKSKGGRAQFERLDDSVATLNLIHPNGDTHTETFSIEDAKRAGLLNNNNWKNFPKAMLRSRCITAGLKSIGFEPTSGTYDPDEAQHFTMPAREEGEQRVGPTATSTGTRSRNGSESARAQATTTTSADRFKELTLEEAYGLTVSDNPKAFKGRGSDLLIGYTTEHLQQLRTWFQERIVEDGHRDDFALRIEAITLILDAREAEQTKLPLDAASAEPLTGEVSEPGQIADALDPTEKAKAREATSRTKRDSTPADPDEIPF